MFGLVNLYKPRGMSSHDVVARLRWLLADGSPPRKVKVGHAGTLDVQAEGVLVVCLGPAVRLVQLLQEWDKQYVTQACLGATSTTDDTEGDITPTAGASAPSPAALEQAARRFVGVVRQVPPAYSAVHVNGRRAYQLARRGRDVDLPPREVTVFALEVMVYEYPLLRLRVRCSGGTYIRSLVRDLGAALGTGAYCRELVRTAVGPLRVEQSVRLEQLAADSLERALLAPVEVIAPEARLPVTAEQARELAFGRAIRPAAATPAGPGLLGAIDPRGQLVALVRAHPDGRIRPVKVFLSED